MANPCSTVMNNNAACRVVVLIGGNGSNLQALIDHASQGSYQIVGVVSHKPDVYGLIRAQQRNIDTRVVDHTLFTERPAFEEQLAAIIDSFEPDLILLAGFMRILSGEFVQQYTGRLLNIHPSLLPDYKGLNTHQRVIENRETHHGCSVHFVTADLDGGPIIAKARITLDNETNVQVIQSRVHKAEHWLYPLVTQWFAAKRLTLKDSTVYFDQQPIAPLGMVFAFEETEGLQH